MSNHFMALITTIIGCLYVLFLKLNLFWILLIILVFISLCALGSYFIQLDFFVKSTHQIPSEGKAIALTFDDGIHPTFTPKLLTILKEKNVKATFFLIGKNCVEHSELVSEINEDGHKIGNHSYEHNFWFSMQTPSQMLKDFQKCEEEIFKIIQQKTSLFRPPYGVTNPMVASAIENGGYQSVGWSLRSYDTVINEPTKLLKKLLKAKNKDIILLHDHGKCTLEILPTFIDLMREKGFNFVTIS